MRHHERYTVERDPVIERWRATGMIASDPAEYVQPIISRRYKLQKIQFNGGGSAKAEFWELRCLGLPLMDAVAEFSDHDVEVVSFYYLDSAPRLERFFKTLPRQMMMETFNRRLFDNHFPTELG